MNDDIIYDAYENVLRAVPPSGAASLLYDRCSNSVSLLEWAEIYNRAAISTIYVEPHCVSFAFLYLIRHSVELALKYVLSDDGMSIEKKYHSHNIDKLYDMACKRYPALNTSQLRRFIDELYHNDPKNVMARYPGEYDVIGKDSEQTDVSSQILPIEYVNVHGVLHHVGSLLKIVKTLPKK